MLLGDAHGAVTAVPLRVGAALTDRAIQNHEHSVDGDASQSASAHASSSGHAGGSGGMDETSEDAVRPAWLPEDFERYAFVFGIHIVHLTRAES